MEPTQPPEQPDSPTPPAATTPAPLRDVSLDACARDYAQAADRRQL